MSTTPNNDAPASEALAAKSQQSGISGRMLAIFYLIAIVLGIVNGVWGSSATQSFADFIATMFIRLFKFVAIPIIAVSIISTLSSISKSRSSGRIFRHTIFYTLFTTILAATLAALLYEVFSPENVSASISGAAAAPLSSVANAGGAGYLKYIESVIPDNILAPFLSANVLSVLLISAAVGIALAQMKPSKAQETLVSLFAGLQEVLFRIVSWIIKVLPIGIFGFFSVLAADLASGVELGGLGVYFAAVLTANCADAGDSPARAIGPRPQSAQSRQSHAAGPHRCLLLKVFGRDASRHHGLGRKSPWRAPPRFSICAPDLYNNQYEWLRSLYFADGRLSHAECGR